MYLKSEKITLLLYNIINCCYYIIIAAVYVSQYDEVILRTMDMGPISAACSSVEDERTLTFLTVRAVSCPLSILTHPVHTLPGYQLVANVTHVHGTVTMLGRVDPQPGIGDLRWSLLTTLCVQYIMGIIRKP